MHRETPRLLIRDWQLPEDLDGAFEMYSDPEVVRYLGMEPAESREACLANMLSWQEHNTASANRTGGWVAVDRALGRVIGNAIASQLPDADMVRGETVQVGWHVVRGDWGKGYATEIGRAMLDYVFEQLGLERVHAVVEVGNDGSCKVAERLGMHYRGLTKQFYGGLELHWYTLQRDQWAAQSA